MPKSLLLKGDRLPILRSWCFQLSVLICPPALGQTLVETEPMDLNERYDWVPAAELTPAQKARIGAVCAGAYIDPMTAAQEADETSSLNPAEAPIHVEADYSNMEDSQVILKGDVDIRQGPRRLAADAMYFNMDTEQAGLEGQVEIRQPGLLVRGAGANVNMAGNEASFTGGEFVLHDSHLRGAAGFIEHRADGVVVLENGELTSCEPGNESWMIRGEQLKVDPEKRQGTGRDVTVRIAGIPVLYTPYISFPLGSERQSGLLFPTVGTSEGGLDITVPYYLNLAPNYDAIIAPRYVSGHGTMLETEFRYLNRYSLNRLSLAYLPDDDGGGDPDVDKLIEQGADEALLRPYQGEERWLISAEHEGASNNGWYSRLDYTKASDIDYFRDLSVASFDVTNSTYVGQGAAIGYHMPHWQFQGQLQTYQNLLADLDPAYRQLPRLSANGRYSWNQLGLALAHEYVDFTNEDETYVTGQRFNLDYELSWSQLWPWGFVQPSIGIQGLAYRLDNQALRPGAETEPALATPYLTLDTGLIFERLNGRQTLEPRLFYLYRDYADHSDLYNVTDPALGPSRDVNFDTTPLTFGYHQLFRDRRFSGGDRLGDADQLTVGLTSRFYDRYGAEEILNVSLGQVFYFSDRRVLLTGAGETQTLEESDLASQIAAQLNERISLQSDLLYNPASAKIMRASANVHYRDGRDRLINVGYRYVREDRLQQATLPVDQMDLAFAWPLNPQWQLMGRLFYDLEEHKELDAFIGFEYDDCCYRLRLLARRWLDSKLADLVTDENRYYDNGIFLEVDLKGLASSGESIQKLLEESIVGWQRAGISR